MLSVTCAVFGALLMFLAGAVFCAGGVSSLFYCGADSRSVLQAGRCSTLRVLSVIVVRLGFSFQCCDLPQAESRLVVSL